MHFVDLEVVMVCSLWCSHFGVCSHQAAVGELRSYATGRLYRPISVIQITAGVANRSVCPGESIFDVFVTCPSPCQDAQCCVTSCTEILQHDTTRQCTASVEFLSSVAHLYEKSHLLACIGKWAWMARRWSEIMCIWPLHLGWPCWNFTKINLVLINQEVQHGTSGASATIGNESVLKIIINYNNYKLKLY